MVTQYVERHVYPDKDEEFDEYCHGCQAKDEEIRRLVSEKNYLQNVILQRTGMVVSDTETKETPQSFQPVGRSRFKPWHVKRQEIEKKRRDARLAKEQEKTEGEKLFEQSLNDAS